MRAKVCTWVFVVLPLVLLANRQASALVDTSAAQVMSGPVPTIFAPGVISSPANDGSPTFTPDGNTLYFTRSTAAWGVILESHKNAGTWSEPTVAPFSGQWSDSSPGMAPDGSYLIFVSTRPKTAPAPGEKPAHFRANLYRVDRTGSTWSEPQRLPDTVNVGPSVWKPSIAADGTLYFTMIDPAGAKRLYSSRYKDGSYQQAAPLPFSDGTTADVDPEIAPDGSFLLFCSSGRVKDDTKDHLYLVLRKGTSWGPVTAIHYAGDGTSTDDEPHLAPDRKTIYFSSDRAVPVVFPRTHTQASEDLHRLNQWNNSNSNVWFMSVEPWLNPA